MYIDPKQKFDIFLENIVPEYYSKNPLVRWLFRKRLICAADFLQKTGAKKVVDMGCGDGSFIKLIKRKNILVEDLWGVDLNSSVVNLIKQIPDVHFAVQNLFQTNFSDHSFDTVVSLDTLEHIDDLSVVIKEFKRILESDGYLITSEPVESTFYKVLRFLLKGTYSEEHGPGSGKHYHNAQGVDGLIRDAGFKRLKLVKIPLFSPFDLFHIALYKL